MILLLNELTALRFALAAWRGEKPRVLLVDPLLPPLRGALERLLRWGRGRGAAMLIDDYPENEQEWKYPTLIFADNVLATIEPWQSRHFRFDLTERDADYGMAVRLLATMFSFRRYMAAFLLNKAGKADWLTPEVLGLARAWFGDAAVPGAKAARLPNRLLNIPAALLGLAAAVWAVVKRVRPSVPREPVFVLADHNADWRDHALYQELKRGGEVVVVMRNDEVRGRSPDMAKAYRNCLPGDGVFDPLGAIAAIWQVLGDARKLYVTYGGLAPALFFEIAVLPYRRMVLRALFNRFRPRYFWARDDYNVEHVLRRQELHRVGGRQHGLNHAVQGITILMPQLRHVSMDAYYTIGSAFHRHFKDTWDVGQLHSIGSFAFTQEFMEQKHRTSTDILFMARFAIGNPEFVRAFRATAEAFPDRRVLLQVKSGYPHDTLTPGFVADCIRDLPNAHHVTDPVYDLVSRADMIVSDPSTIIAEAAQLGTPVLMIDVIPGQKTSIFREFPGLCAATAEDVVAQLKRWASGADVFDPRTLAALVNLEKRPYYVQVCAGMGVFTP